MYKSLVHVNDWINKQINEIRLYSKNKSSSVLPWEADTTRPAQKVKYLGGLAPAPPPLQPTLISTRQHIAHMLSEL